VVEHNSNEDNASKHYVTYVPQFPSCIWSVWFYGKMCMLPDWNCTYMKDPTQGTNCVIFPLCIGICNKCGRNLSRTVKLCGNIFHFAKNIINVYMYFNTHILYINTFSSSVEFLPEFLLQKSSILNIDMVAIIMLSVWRIKCVVI